MKPFGEAGPSGASPAQTSPAQAPLGKSFAKEEDLGETRLFRRGRSLQASPGETFPRRRPPVLHIALESAVRMGACAGEFLLGLGGQLTIGNVQLAISN